MLRLGVYAIIDTSIRTLYHRIRLITALLRGARTQRNSTFKTAVPFWGQTIQIPSILFPKRDCSRKRVEIGCFTVLENVRNKDRTDFHIVVKYGPNAMNFYIRVEVKSRRVQIKFMTERLRNLMQSMFQKLQTLRCLKKNIQQKRR